MNKNRKKALLLLVLSNAALLFCVISYLILIRLFDQNASGSICHFQNVFHFYCPGCGGSRSLRALVRFDLVRSFICYPPLPLSLPIVGYAEYLLILGVAKSDARQITRFKVSLLIIPAALILINFAARNILLFNGIDFLGDIL